jgi:hypothetical protein
VVESEANVSRDGRYNKVFWERRPTMKWCEYAEVGQEHHIAHVHQDGTLLTLEDGSVWDIPIDGSTLVAQWYQGQRVIVRVNEAEGESYALINVDTTGSDVVMAHVRKTRSAM